MLALSRNEETIKKTTCSASVPGWTMTGRLSLSSPVARAVPICAISRAASTAPLLHSSTAPPLPCPPHDGQASFGNAADTQADKKSPRCCTSEHASAMKPKRR